MITAELQQLNFKNYKFKFLVNEIEIKNHENRLHASIEFIVTNKI